MKRITSVILLLFAALSLCRGQIGGDRIKWEGEFKDGKLVLTATLPPSVNHVSGSVNAMPCAGDRCFAPEDWDFDFSAVESTVIKEPVPEPEPMTQTVKAIDDPVTDASELDGLGTATVPPIEGSGSDKAGMLSLIIEAILWGLAMLLTPCVFPMVPMTVSYFIKGNGDKRRGRFNALMYGVFIVVLYTVPICLIIGSTWLIGGASVTADIFNWLSTHWLPNIIFFLVFLAFALSFFGVFEFVMPSSLVNSVDRKSDRKGLGGIFFMALTLVLVSFSCTGPIVGTVLIKSTSGEFWAPMVTMLAFSIAFALPFVLLALFPSVLRNLPKSGGWMNTVKISLGFIELALGLKFLSVADQTYHWGILPRNGYLAIWIILFTLLALYLVGVLKFHRDEEKPRFSALRIIWLAIVCAFTIYLFSGFYGNSLKALSGYLPPEESAGTVSGSEFSEVTIGPDMSLEQALEKAAALGRKVFVDITGYGCVNCREMESLVWTDRRVRDILSRDYLIVKIHMDDKTVLPESEWIVTEGGKTLKDAGRVNSYMTLKRFGVNSMPNYFILSADGTVVKGPYAYNTSIDDFLNFLL